MVREIFVLSLACWCVLTFAKAVPVKRSIDASSSSSNDLYEKLVSDLQDVLADKVKKRSQNEELLSKIKNLLTNQKRDMESSEIPSPGLTWGNDQSYNGLTRDSSGKSDNTNVPRLGLTWEKRTNDLMNELQDILKRGKDGPLRSWRLGASGRGGKRELSEKLQLFLDNKRDELPAKKESDVSYGLSKKNDETPKLTILSVYKRLVNDLNDLLEITENDNSATEKKGANSNDDLMELINSARH